MGIRSILHELCLWGSCRLLEEVQRCPYAIKVSNRKLQLSHPLAKCKLSLSTREPCGETVPGFIQRLDKEPRYNDFQENGPNASSHLSYQTLGCDLFYCLPICCHLSGSTHSCSTFLYQVCLQTSWWRTIWMCSRNMNTFSKVMRENFPKAQWTWHDTL